MELPRLSGERVVLRPLARTDVARLAELGADPEVARWWPGLTADHVAEKLDEPALGIEAEGDVAGLIQFHEHDDPDFRHAGIDVFLGAPHHGRGLGPDAVRTLARWLFESRGHHRLTIDPAADNARAIRAYEQVGFRRVGILRRYWRDPDGVWRDGLLMELLAEDIS